MTTRAKAEIFKPKAYTATNHPLSETLLPREPKSISQALQDPIWLKSLQAEFHALEQANTWTLVPFDPNVNIMRNKWIFHVKLKVDGSVDRCKSILVAKGFSQTAAIDYYETFSLLVKPVTVRLILILTLSHPRSIQQLDVSNAFLNGVLSENVNMCQPEGFVDF